MEEAPQVLPLVTSSVTFSSKISFLVQLRSCYFLPFKLRIKDSPKKDVKLNLKLNSRTFEKCKYGHFGTLVYTLNQLFVILKLNFPKNKKTKKTPKNRGNKGKTPFFVISLFCTTHSSCLNISF